MKEMLGSAVAWERVRSSRRPSPEPHAQTAGDHQQKFSSGEQGVRASYTEWDSQDIFIQRKYS